jgi:hypothetical protein
MLQIASWGDELYLKKLSDKIIGRVDMRCFRDTLQYWRLSKTFKADAFLIFSDLEPKRLYNSGVNFAFNLRALFDIREPIIVTSFSNLIRNSGGWNLARFFSYRGNYFLRLPLGSPDLSDTVRSGKYCYDTLELRQILIDSGYFDKLKHDLTHLSPRDEKTKIIAATLHRFKVHDS